MKKVITSSVRYLMAVVTAVGLFLAGAPGVIANSLVDSTHYYSGTIGGETAISLRLGVKEGAVSGLYVYDQIGIPLILIGTIDTTGNLVMSEYDENAVNTGVFQGLATSGRIEGMWRRPDGGGELRFSAIQAQGWSGKWTWAAHHNAAGELEIENVTESEFTFKLNVVNLYRAHFGRIRGTAKINANEAVWEDGQGARLTMRLDQDKINIATQDCQKYAGMAVGFDGPYLRGPQLSLVRRGVFQNAVQQLNFVRLVSEDRARFFNAMGLVSPLRDLDGFGVTVNKGFARYKIDEIELAIIMCSADGGIWAAVVDDTAHNIRYYTNRPAGEALPKTIAAWRGGLSMNYDVVFMNR